MVIWPVGESPVGHGREDLTGKVRGGREGAVCKSGWGVLGGCRLYCAVLLYNAAELLIWAKQCHDVCSAVYPCVCSYLALPPVQPSPPCNLLGRLKHTALTGSQAALRRCQCSSGRLQGLRAWPGVQVLLPEAGGWGNGAYGNLLSHCSATFLAKDSNSRLTWLRRSRSRCSSSISSGSYADLHAPRHTAALSG